MLQGAIRVGSGPTFTLERRGRFLVATLIGPHRVISSSAVNSGLRENVRYLINHQVCEGTGHDSRGQHLLQIGQQAYHQEVCTELEIEAGEAVLMGTAANMQCVAMADEPIGDDSITVAATAGVHGNAARAGDPAGGDEIGGQWHAASEPVGTLNLMVLSQRPMSEPGLVRAVTMMSEAKTAALSELAVPSRYSRGLATGTGTDQFAIAAPLGTADTESTWAGHHTLLGQQLARAVIAAIKEALRWQNGLGPQNTANVFYALDRLGVTELKLEARLEQLLEPAAFSLLRDNWKPVFYDPQVAACAYAMAAVVDRIGFGVFPAGAVHESLVRQAGVLAGQVAAKPLAADLTWSRLNQHGSDLLELVARAIAVGWTNKWS